MRSRLTLNGFNVDLKNDESIAITFVNNDKKKTEEQRRTSSKPVTFPSTKRNREYFASVYNMQFDSKNNVNSYNPTVRQNATLYADSRIVFEGLFQMNKIVQLGDDYEIHGVLFSNVLNLYEQVGNTLIQELGWEEYNHDLTEANIVNSWNTSIQRPQGTTVINTTASGGALGFGYYYGIVDWGLAGDYRATGHFTSGALRPKFRHNEIVPMVYVKEILYKMFEQTDYTLQIELGTALPNIGFNETSEPATGTTANWTYAGGINTDDNLLNRLLLTYEGGSMPELTAGEILAAQVQLDGLGGGIGDDIQFSKEIKAIPREPYPNFFGWDLDGKPTVNLLSRQNLTTTTDPSGQYVSEFGRFTFNSSGTFDVRCSLAFTNRLTINVTGTTQQIFSDTSVNALRIDLVTKRGRIRVYSTKLNPVLLANTIYSDVIEFDVTVPITVDQRDEAWFEISYETSYNITTDTDATAVSMTWEVDSDLTPLVTQIQIDRIDNLYQTNDEVKLASYMPKLTCRDFFKGFLDMFNLIVEDPDEDNVIKIWKYEDFYNDPIDAIDWTSKLDRSKQIEIVPATQIEGRFYKYNFADSKSYTNDFYFRRMREFYGDRTFEVPSTWQKGDKLLKLPFSQAPLQEMAMGGNLSKMTVPRCIQITDNAIYPTSYSDKPHIFIRGNDPIALKGTIAEFTLENTTGSASTNYGTYGYVGHFFNEGSGQVAFDLNFNTPKEIYFTGTDISTYDYASSGVNAMRNFWDLHKPMILEITDQDQKMYRAYFKLNDSDIETLNFGDYIQIDSVIYKLNIIREWRVGQTTTVLVELFKYIKLDINEPIAPGPTPPTIPPQET